MTNLEELRRLATEATPGPWEHDEDGPIAHRNGGRTRRILSINTSGDQRTADSKFVAAANPAAILALLDEVERLRKDAGRYRWAKEHIAEEYSFAGGYYLSDDSSAWDKTIDAAMAEMGAEEQKA